MPLRFEGNQVIQYHSSTTFSLDTMTNLHPVPSDDFATMDDDALAAAVSTLAAHIHAATYRLLALIAELDRREVWAAQGALSCAHWLSWACGIDTHTAREKVRVARALGELPLLSEALAKGELGYSRESSDSRREHAAPCAGTIEVVDIGAVTCGRVVGGRSDDVARDAIRPRKRRRPT